MKISRFKDLLLEALPRLGFGRRGREEELQEAHGELGRVHEELRKSLALLDTVSGKAPIGLGFVDREFRHIRINERLATINGSTVEGCLGRTVAEVVPDRWGKIEGFYRRALSGEEVRDVGVSCEFEGGELHVMASYYPVWGEGADSEKREPIGVGLVIVDVTALRVAQRKLEESDRRKDEFLATLAHELRNPMAAMRSGLELLKRGEVDSDGEIVGMVDRHMSSLVRLVNDLMDTSRIAEGKMRIVRRAVSIRAVLEHAVEEARGMVEGSGQRLEIVWPAEDWQVAGDLVRLSQVFCNLMGNCAKFGREGGVVRVVCEREGDEVLVRVRDEGIGMRAEMLGRAFEMFSQEKVREREHGGLGIGLHLVRRIVEKHGGSVEAFSEGLGKGTEVVVRLGLMVSGEVGADEGRRGLVVERRLGGERVCVREEAGGRVEGGRGVARRRILVADDNRDSARAMARLLRREGHEVEVAFDGEAALDKAEAFRPDVMVLDIGMPKVNGYEVARRVRSAEWGRKVKLVAVTGWGAEEDQREAEAAGFNRHLVKPVTLEELLEVA